MEQKKPKKPKDSHPTGPDSPARPTVVGIGASAGGLSALKRLFERIPPESGLAFVVVVHLSPEHKSLLADLLQPSVQFPVRQVMETTPLEANTVYVIPPNANLSAIDSHLRLSKLEEMRRERAPIDHFFRTLAGTHDGHSIGVILTGTGSDGTLGLKEIKARGGLILVQDPNDAEFDGMPQSAIATGLVDRILPIAEIPEALLRLTQVGARIAFNGGHEELAQPERLLLPKVVAVLKARTERDFSRYKPATMLRRIARRMQLNYIEDFERYLEKLREHPEEVRALADDLLITVTSFFRDPEVFQKLETHVVPQLFEGKRESDTVRVWSVGCATGEEAYSVAILLLEEAARRENPPTIQIFASDLHKRSLEGAREGIYPGDIETDVSPERLKRFFQKQNGGYRISKEVRETVVFAPHNLLSDPPFSRLQLITCRNLLIYLDRTVQRDVTDLFHYALCPDGFLLLGSAETIDASELFRTEDKRLCLYRKRNVPAPEPRLPVFPITRVRVFGEHFSPSENAHATIAYHSLHQNLLERYAPPSILIGPDNKLVHLSENAGRYLVHPGGEITLSAVRLVRDELRIELQALLQTARETKELVDSKPIPVRFNGHSAPVVMHVRPAQELESDGFALVIFEEHQSQSKIPRSVPGDSETSAEAGQSAARIAELEEELHAARQSLQTTIEEYETSREEMNASNEEMQSTNEELRSTLEELETSKEELQSINEELQTVNQENRHKVEELSQLSSDLQNLLFATDIATLFLDRDLRILRFTPRLADLFNVRVTDRGRPILDLTHRLGYVQLREDAQEVLDRLIPVEREIQDDQARWYLTRVLPYRSTDDRIEGVVITFTDITARKQTEGALSESEDRQAFLLKLSDTLRPLHEAGAIQAASTRLLGEHLAVDRAAYGQLQPSGETMSVTDEWKTPGAASVIGEYRIDDFGAFFTRPLREGGTSVIEDALNDPRVSRDAYSQTWGAIHTRAAIAHALVKNGKFVGAIFVHQKDRRSWSKGEISIVSEVGERTWEALERARVETELRRSEEKYRSLFESIDEGFCVIDLIYGNDGEPVDYRFREANPAFERHTGQRISIGQLRSEVNAIPEPDWLQLYAQVDRTGEPVRRENYHEPTERWYSAYASRVGGPENHRVAIVFEDITERKRSETSLRESKERQALLLRLSDTLQTISNPAEIQSAAMQVLGEHLGLSRAFYFRVERDHDGLAHVIESEYRRDPGQISVIGRHPLKHYGSWLFEGLEQGRALEISDVGLLDRLTPDELASYRALGVAAFINVPLLRNGDFNAGITAHDTVPRAWKPTETALMREVAERAWDAIERARAEEALRESEQKFRTLANTAPALIWQNDATGGNLFINQNFLEYTGMSAEEIRGAGWHTLVHPDDAPAYIADYLGAVSERRRWRNRNRIRRHDGEWRWFENYAEPLFGRDGRYLGHVGLSLNVNEQVEGEQTLRVNEKRLRGQKEAFQSAINGAPLRESLGILVRIVSEETEGAARSAFYMADNDLACLHPIPGATDMPESYTKLVDRFPIGHESLACGLASASGRPVLTRDVAKEPLWVPWMHLAEEYGFRGCWSFPIETRDYKPIGTFAMYFGEPCEPSPRHIALAEVVTQTAAIILSRHAEVQERSRAEKTLRGNEEWQRTLLEGIPQLVWRSRANGDWTWASPQWMSFTGQSQEQSLGQGWLAAVRPDDYEVIKQAWSKAAATGMLDVECRVRRASDGAYVCQHTSALPVRGPDEHVVEWLGTFTDIEQIKQAETARREAEEQFRLFVKNVQEYALVQTDPEGLITSWNPGAVRLFGYAPERMIGQFFAVLLTAEDQDAGVFQEELAWVTAGQRHEDARWFVREDGSRFWARWITEPMLDESGRFRGLAKIMRDETERERSAAFTRHSLAEKEELLKEVHHRVKNNLQVIVSLVNLQASHIRDEHVLALFQETRNRVLAISSIHELLYHAESFANIVLADYAKQLAPSLVRFYGLEKRITVEVLGDGARLDLERAVPYGMLLNELISNSCKHAFPSAGKGTIRITINPVGSDIELIVADTGQGLPPGFDKEKSTSLGLKLVRSLVRQLRGTLEFRSDNGAVVIVKFPAPGAAALDGKKAGPAS